VFGDTVELVYNGSDDRVLDLRPNHALYWGVLEWAAANGFRRVDLGGAYRDTQLARFKQQWGAVPRARFRLTYRAGGQASRAESLARAGYGVEDSKSRLLGLAWRAAPARLLQLGGHVAYRWL
jgi:hypothetical protein